MSPYLIELYKEAWLHPRRSMRRILDLSLTERDRLMMVAVTFVLFSIPVAINARGQVLPDGQVMSGALILQLSALLVVGGIVGYYITAMIVKAVGALFGGTASYEDSKTCSAWAQFVTGLAMAALTLLTLPFPAIFDSFKTLLFLAANAYIGGSYAAEAHGFRSSLPTIGAFAAISLFVMLNMTAMMSSGIPQVAVQ